MENTDEDRESIQTKLHFLLATKQMTELLRDQIALKAAGKIQLQRSVDAYRLVTWTFLCKNDKFFDLNRSQGQTQQLSADPVTSKYA